MKVPSIESNKWKSVVFLCKTCPFELRICATVGIGIIRKFITCDSCANTAGGSGGEG